MSDLHTDKVMQQGDADAKQPRPAFGWRAALISVLLLLIGAAILFPVFSSPHSHRPSNRPLSNLKQLALASYMYATDYDDLLPPAETWMDHIDPYSKNEQILHDPSIKDRKDDEYGFAFFDPASCINPWSVRDSDKVPLLFQSVLMRRNAHGDLSTLPAVPRDEKMNIVAFLDGHARGFPPTWPNGPISIVIDPSLDESGAKE
jgi:hypothetical protein